MVDYMKAVRKAFENVGPSNPLKELSDSDKCLLVALLHVYVVAPKTNQALDGLEVAAGIASEAGALAKRIQSDVLGGQIAQILAPFLGRFRDLPARLVDFARIGTLVHNLAGKPGHKGRLAKSNFLIMASEFVRLKTGRHNDEHLAELLQAVNFDLGAETAEISGDSIRKKREHFKTAYPVSYAHTINKVRDFRSLPAGRKLM